MPHVTLNFLVAAGLLVLIGCGETPPQAGQSATVAPPQEPLPHGDVYGFVDMETVVSEAAVNWVIPVRAQPSTGRFGTVAVAPAGEGDAYIAGSGSGPVEFGSEPVWSSLADGQDFASLVKIDVEGALVWDATFVGDSAYVRHAAVGPDSVLLCLDVGQETTLPGGGTAGVAGDSALLANVGADGQLLWSTVLLVGSSARCAGLARVGDGWMVTVFGTDDEARAMGQMLTLDDAGGELWRTTASTFGETSGGAGPDYAYAFGATPDVAGHVLTSIWSRPGFAIQGLIHTNGTDTESATTVVALDRATGAPLWARAAGTSGGFLAEPETGTVLTYTYREAPAGFEVEGLHPADGETVWTTTLDATPPGGLTDLWWTTPLRTPSGTWLFQGNWSTEYVVEPQQSVGFLLELDPTDGHRPSRLVTVPWMAWAGGGALVDVNTAIVQVSGFEAAPLELFGEVLAPDPDVVYLTSLQLAPVP